jgi:hypothetical protein
MVAGMAWEDTTTGLLKLRNSANSDWVVVAPLTKDWAASSVLVPLGALSATKTFRIYAARLACKIERVALLSDTATASSAAGTTEWQFGLQNATTTNQLFSGTVGTGTALSGVGGGAELAVNTTYPLVPNQNAALAANAALLFTVTKVGSPTSPLADVVLLLDLTLSN